MSDSPPPAAATPSPEVSATTSAAQLPNSPTDSDKTIAAPMQDANPHQEFLPACGAAIFSTELCTQTPRQSAGPPYPPVIVRGGDKNKAVVDAAHYWQKKFKWQCLCIFPGQGWEIRDLWDAVDIHVESSPFCEQMLIFISRDTYYAAKQFSEDWARAHPDRLAFIGGEMMSVFDPVDPFAIVDKVFTYGEPEDFPRTFLWHVAHMMRTTMAEISAANNAAMEANHAQQPVLVNQQPATNVALDIKPTGAESAVVAKRSSLPNDAPIESAPSKTNRKKTRSRPRKLTVSTEPSPAVDTSMPMPAAPPAAPNQPAPRVVSKHVPSHGPPQSGYPIEPMGGVMGGMTGPTMMSPNMPAQTLRIAKGTPRNMGSNFHNQPLVPHGWAENVNRVPSGPYSRHGSGAMPNIQSPQFIPGTMAMGQPVMIPPNAILPYAHGPPFISPSMTSNQQFDPAMSQRGMLPGQPMSMQMAPMGQAYMHQAHQVVGARGVSMGNMTNNVYYPNTMPSQHMDPRASMPRQASQFNSGGILYDPYNGANPKFNDAAVYSGGKKPGQNGFSNQPGRPRKSSHTINRQGYGQLSSDRPGNMPTNTARHSEHGFRKGRLEDDPVITQDRSCGCNDSWIGPKNETVTELFVGDLPDDVQVHELKHLFEQQVGITPSQVDIKHAPEQHHRLHAFISFSSASDAKKALQIRDRKPYLRDGSVAVAVSVPRRFFQKAANSIRRGSFTSGSYNGPSHASQLDERDARGTTHLSSHDEESVVTVPQKASGRSLYSPQDARSDLQKRTVRQPDDNDPILGGSPKARKSKHRQSSPTKEATIEPQTHLEMGTSVEVEVAEDDKPVEANRLSPVKAEMATTDRESKAAEEAAEPLAKLAVQDETGTSTLKEPSTSLMVKSGSIRDTDGAAHEAHGLEDDTEPQTQSIIESSTVETKSPVVNIPVSLGNDVLVSEQLPTEGKEFSVEQPERPAPSSYLVSAEDAGSDDDAKNDTSFHSAQESQTELAHVEQESEPEHRNESIPMNQGTMTSNFSSTKEASTLSNIVLVKTATEEKSPENPQSPPAQPEQEALTKSEAKTLVMKDTEVIATPTHNVAAEPKTNVALMAASSAQPVVEALKKGGAPQIQSLSPFAKPTKAQQKKEKELRKKQQKREQAEKEAKAKVEKTKSSAKLNVHTTVETKVDQPQCTGDTAFHTDDKPEIVDSSQASVGEVAEVPKEAKGKGKALIGSTVHEGGKAKGEGEGKDHADIIGGNTTNVPKETASVTHKNKESQIMKAEPMTQVLSLATGAPDARSPEVASAVAENRQVDLPNLVSPASPTKSSDTRVSPKKKKKPIPAVPNLNFHPDRLSTHGKGPELSTTGVSLPSTSTATTTVSTPFEKNMSHPTNPPGASSAASSSTLNPEYLAITPSSATSDSGNASKISVAPAPPRTDEPEAKIHQADVPGVDAPKKKKKKPKKKSKKPADAPVPAKLTDATEPSDAATVLSVANSDTGSDNDEDNEFYDPFSSQFSHIDAIRRGLKDPSSYYDQVNVDIEADKKAAEVHASKTQKLFESSLMNQIEEYMKENPLRFMSTGEKASQNNPG
ncbi:Nn.00g094370.m01.CDS01 [Neocucurbitaria sp. VM-36]